MGCDGGSIPTRSELVKTKKKQQESDPFEKTRIRLRFCALSKEPLSAPIVCCPLGNLFNKEAVLTHLLAKNMPPEFQYIKSIKDLVPVNFTPNPAYEETKAVYSEDAPEGTVSPFICPVTGLETNGRYSFMVLKTCGCALSERALKEVPAAECLQCRKPYTEADILPLNPTPQQLEQLRQTLPKERKVKKRKHHKKESKNATRQRPEKEAKVRQKKRLKPLPAGTDAFLAAGAPETYASEAYRSIFTSSLTGRELKSTFTHYS